MFGLGWVGLGRVGVGDLRCLSGSVKVFVLQIQFKDACRQGSPDCASDASQGHMRSPCDSLQQQEEGEVGGIRGTVKSLIYPHPTPVNPSMSSCDHGYCGCVEAPVKGCLRLSSDALKRLCSATYSGAARKEGVRSLKMGLKWSERGFNVT